MHIKVMEMVGESPDGWRSAVQSAVSEASKTVNNIVGVEVVNFTANVENGRVVEYKANVKIAHTS
ncbi:dodecin domain-containing protein [Desulfallas sp. Bu1-1]|uniref:dodecin family protein n=1 Tax=Desulfallas sp. Bu1-1 TaxID=2787620 RepID=UPI00189F314D|nr:dodecin family protein [Desulfallas sp. Bu1-1]MBF7082055.1 dodecin domain-containing protein [Desulfallas sp. Bu1-1]